MRDKEQGSKLFVKGDIDMVDTLGDIPMIYNTRSANFFVFYNKRRLFRPLIMTTIIQWLLS